MDTAQEYIDNLADYEEVENNNLYINDILTISQLETIDQLLLSFIDHNRRKTASVIGYTLNSLKKSNQMVIFNSFENDSAMLLAQRINYLVSKDQIKAYGNVKAIRFSELSI